MKKLFVAAFACAMACGVVAENLTVTSLDDIATAATALQVRPGDTVTLPTAGSGETYEAANNYFAAVEGTTFTALRPGIVSVFLRGSDSAIAKTACFIVVPEPIGNGTIYIRADNSSQPWQDVSAWRLVDGSAATDYPHRANDIAVIPRLSNGQYFKVSEDISLGGLYVGAFKSGIDASFYIQRADGVQTIPVVSFARTDGKPAMIQVCGNHRDTATGKTTVLQFGDSNNKLGFKYECDTIFDGGWDGTDYHCARGRPKYMNNCTNEIPTGVTFTWRNTDNEGSGNGYNFDAPVLKGGGTVWNRSSSNIAYVSNRLSDEFTGVVRDSSHGNTNIDRSGPTLFKGGAVTNASAEAYGFVRNSSGSPSRSTSGVGMLFTGHNGWGAPGYHGNYFPQRGLTLVNSLFVCGATENSGWGVGVAEVKHTAKMVVGRGFSFIDRIQERDNASGHPINWFDTDALVHQDKGTIRIDDIYRSNYVDPAVKTNNITILHGFGNHAVGGTGNPKSSANYPIIPWMVTPSKNTDNGKLAFTCVDATDRICDMATRTSHALDAVVGTDENAYVKDASAALTEDRTVNSLWIYNSGKEKKLGVGKTLTVTSGGVILRADGSSIGTVDGGEANGALVLGDATHPGYVFADATTASKPGSIYAPVTAPGGLVFGYTGYALLAGDQTGVDDELVLNAGTLDLGSQDGAVACKLDVPIRVLANATVKLNAAEMESSNIYFDDIAGWSGKIQLNAEMTTCQKLYVRDTPDETEWTSMPVGTYGATGSGADNIDDVHFTGTGVLNVLRDDLGWPKLENVAITDFAEKTITVGGHAVLGSGASELKLYTLLRKDGETAVATNLFKTASEEDDFTTTIADLDDGTLYHVAVYASNLVPSAVPGEAPLFFDAISDWMDVTTRAVAHVPEMTVDPAAIDGTASKATIPWTLVSKGYENELTELKLFYGLSADVLDQVLVLDPVIERGAQTTQLSGLVGDTTYYAKFWAKNDYGDGEEGESDVFSFTTKGPFAVTGAAESYTVNGDVVAKFAGDGTFIVPENVTARVLVVGGGGAGGRQQGGGGGGGQVIDTMLELTPGSYTVTIGAGGVVTTSTGSKPATINGGASSIAQGDNVLVSAMGGGAGGNYSDTASLRNGEVGGNGGGATTGTSDSKTGSGGTALVVGGFAGGDSAAIRVAAGGGGGAGEAGEAGFAAVNGDPFYAKGGKGGDGVASDITGETVWYGAGGGGGAYSTDAQIEGADKNRFGLPGDGGKGGGGNGGGGNYVDGTFRGASAGVDGLGGGGGGGARYNGKTTLPEYVNGANGGSGTVIVRFTQTLPDPMVTEKVEPGATSASAELTLTSAGWNETAANVTVTLGGAEVFNGEIAVGAKQTVAFNGLTGGTAYTFTVTAENAAGGQFSQDVEFTTLGATAGTGGTITCDGDYVIHTFLADGTLTLPAGVIADVLLVGGGGAGGHALGGGGGAGGLIYERGVRLAGGAYDITVGAGGQPVTTNSKPGGNGGDSVLAFGGTDVFRAVGGGGGGNYQNSDGGAYGAAGGSGGGNARYRFWPRSGVEGQGNCGGTGMIANGNIAGGGGGAGEPGGSPVNSDRTAGKGGDGREIAITGASVWYAGGGAGGTYFKKGDGTWKYYRGGLGGKGGGGNGGGGSQDGSYQQSVACSAYILPTAGVDGLGGGGGGGGSNDWKEYGGAKGGSGVVIVRYYAPQTAGAAVAATRVEAKQNGTVEIGYTVLSSGTGIAKIEAECGVVEGRVFATKTLATNVTKDGTAVLSGVNPGSTTYVTLKVTDTNGAVTRSYLGPVKVPGIVEDVSSELGSHPGLWQAEQIGDAKDFSFDILSSDTRRLEYGTVMATILGNPGVSGTWKYTSPIDGVVSEWEAAKVFAYKGYIYLRKGTYHFAASVDDYGFIKVNGQTIICGLVSCGPEIAPFVAEADGWYPIEVRIGNVGGAAGYVDSSWNSNGISYRRVNDANLTSESYNNFIKLVTPAVSDAPYADFLRTAMPGRAFGVELTANAGATFTATAHIAAGGEGDALYACVGSTTENDFDVWTQKTKIADLAATAVDQPISISGLTDADAFVRFAIVGSDGKVTWSKTFKRDVFGVPEIGEVVSGELTGEAVTFTGEVPLKGGSGSRVVLHYGTTEEASDVAKNITAEVGANGRFSVTIEGLQTATKYFWYVEVISASGVTVTSQTQQFSEPGSVSVSNLIVDNTHGREIHMSVDVTAIGAGGSATLTAYARKWDSKGQRAYSIVASKVVNATGSYELIWDASDEVEYADYWTIYVSGANTSASGKSWASDTSGVNFPFYDNATYTWTGAAGNGLWSDAGNWSTDATCDRAGWPYCGATVIFPAGCDATVTMPAMGMLHMKSIQLKEGSSAAPTKVTLVGDGNPENFISVEKPDGTLQTNGSFAFGQYCEFTLDGVAIMSRANCGSFDLGANGKLHLKNGAALSVNGETKLHHDNTTVILEGDSTLESYNHLYFGGENSTFVIDNSYVEVLVNDNRFYCNQDRKSTSKIIFRGDHPRVQSAGFRVDSSDSSGEAYLYFEVPRGGFAQAPIRQRRQNKSTYKFSANSKHKINCFISSDSPALAYAEDVSDIPVIDWFDAVNKAYVINSTELDGATVTWTYGTRYGIADATLSVSLTNVAGTGRDTLKTPSEPEVTQFGGYTIYKWTDVKNAGLITFDEDVEADLLVIGGGGAGGWSYPEDKEYQTGGGGAGGMIYKQGITIPAGTYPIYVGAGGEKRSWDFQIRPGGKNGYDSFAFGYRAFGGGGGGPAVFDSTYRGQPGGSGGGASNASTTIGPAIDPTQGNNGGSGVGNNCAGGGGGAGAVGGNGNGTNPITAMTSCAGNGGDGLPCDITGETIYYAAGGGAGASNRGFLGGLGGNGGGGNGGGRYIELASDGVDGLGGGGGGAGYNREAYYRFPAYNNGAVAGGKGGDGVVILRVKNADYDTTLPQVAFVKATPKCDGASVAWNYVAAGEGAASTDFKFVYGPDADTMTGECAISGIAATGAQTSDLAGLAPNRTYFAKIVATTDGGKVGESAVFSFTTAAEKGDGSFYAGLIEGSSMSYKDTSFDIAAAADAKVVEGARMAWLRNGWKRNQTYGYTGYIYLEGGVTYYFGNYFYDYDRLMINGTTVIDKTDASNGGRIFNATYSVLTSGWYPIDIRLSNSTDNQVGAWNYFTYGLAWSTDPNRDQRDDCTDTTGWNKFIDPGDGSFLRVSKPVSRDIMTAGALWNGDKTELTVNVSATPEPVAVKLTACYSEIYGGDDLLRWITLDAGTIAANESGRAVTFSDLPPEGYIRFCGVILDADGNPTGEKVWSDSLLIQDCTDVEASIPTISFESVVPGALDAKLNVSVLSVGSGSETCAVYAKFGTSLDALTETRTLNAVATVGAAAMNLAGLLPETTYYVSVWAQNATGATEESAVKSFTTIPLVENNSSAGEAGGSGAIGLYQAKVGKAWEPDFDIMSDATCVLVPDGAGASFCYASNGTGTKWSDVNGTQYVFSDNTTYGYTGYWYTEAGDYVIGGSIDDNGTVYVDGMIVGGANKFGGQNWQTTTLTLENGWHAITIYLGNGTGGAGPWAWNPYGLAFNNQGVTAKGDTAVWHQFKNVEGETPILRPVIPGREVKVDSYSIEGGTLTANLSFGDAMGESYDLYAVYGDAYGYEDTNAWAHVVKIGTFGDETATYEYTELTGLGTDVKYVRFFFDGATVNWSSTILLVDTTTPKIDAASAKVEELWRGDFVKATCSLVYDAGGACTVTAETSALGDFTDTVSTACALDNETGLYGALVLAEPGVKTYLRFCVTGANGKSDRTSVIEFTTDAASVIAATASGSSSHTTITLSGTIDTIGAHLENEGTFIRLVGGTEYGSKEPLGNWVSYDKAGAYSVSGSVSWLGATWYVMAECSNCCASASWVSYSQVVAVTPSDAATYTWTGAGSDTLWSNPDNWTCNQTINNGYPSSSGATAAFPANTSGTVTLDRIYGIGTVKLDQTGYNLVFESTNPDVANGGFTASIAWGGAGTSLVFDSVQITDNSGDNTGYNQKANVTLKMIGKTVFTHPNKFIFASADGYFEVGPEATFKVTTDGKPFATGGEGVKIRIDGTIDMGEGFNLNDYASVEQNGTLTIGGTAPSVTMRNTVVTYATGSQAIVFDIPKTGWETAPIRPRDPANSNLKNFLEGSKCDVTLSIDPQSQIFRKDGTHEITLVDWTNSKSKKIDTTHLVVPADTDDVKWTVTTTQIKVTVTGRGRGLKIILR